MFCQSRARGYAAIAAIAAALAGAPAWADVDARGARAGGGAPRLLTANPFALIPEVGRPPVPARLAVPLLPRRAAPRRPLPAPRRRPVVPAGQGRARRGHRALPPRGGPGAALAGLAAGHALVGGYWQLLPAPPHTRAQFAADRALAILGGVVLRPLVHVAGALGWFWIFLVPRLRRARDLAPLALVLAVGALALDFMRVVVVCALPIVLHVAARVSAGRVHDWSWLRWPVRRILVVDVRPFHADPS